MRCGQCQHWQIRGSGEGWGEHCIGFGRCKYAEMFDDITTWQDDGDNDALILKPEYADRKFAVMDGSSYKAELYTAPDFFCAHYTGKS